METADATANDQSVRIAPETPSGKTAGDENFPVASLLIRRALRPHIKAYYDFARAIDDIADNPALSAGEKIARLDAFESVLTGAENPSAGFEKATALRGSLAETGVSVRHATDLVSAFRQDAENGSGGTHPAILERRFGSGSVLMITKTVQILATFSTC